MAQIDRLFEEALGLTPSERSELADRLLSSLESSDVDTAWKAVARDRLARLKSGETRGIPWEQTRARLFAR